MDFKNSMYTYGGEFDCLEESKSWSFNLPNLVQTNKCNVRIWNFLNINCYAYKQTKQASAMIVYAFLVDPSLLHKQMQCDEMIDNTYKCFCRSTIDANQSRCNN
jgi:hypothetical protein